MKLEDLLLTGDDRAGIGNTHIHDRVVSCVQTMCEGINEGAAVAMAYVVVTPEGSVIFGSQSGSLSHVAHLLFGLNRVRDGLMESTR